MGKVSRQAGQEGGVFLMLTVCQDHVGKVETLSVGFVRRGVEVYSIWGGGVLGGYIKGGGLGNVVYFVDNLFE
jgi:hypothetical protein